MVEETEDKSCERDPSWGRFRAPRTKAPKGPGGAGQPAVAARGKQVLQETSFGPKAILQVSLSTCAPELTCADL